MPSPPHTHRSLILALAHTQTYVIMVLFLHSPPPPSVPPCPPSARHHHTCSRHLRQDPDRVMFEVLLYLEPPSAQSCPAQEETRNRGDISLFFKYYDWQVGRSHTVEGCMHDAEGGSQKGPGPAQPYYNSGALPAFQCVSRDIHQLRCSGGQARLTRQDLHADV